MIIYLKDAEPKSHMTEEDSRIWVQKKNQLYVTECFIAFMIRWNCFGQLYAHHQELESVCVLLPSMVCSAWLLVVGVQGGATGYASRKRDVHTKNRIFV